ncbi:PEP-CTERM sorting domain-containing protein [Methyloversatilis sp. RAC08]|uniref:PEP-CTERM sorting domain-containing protein n=1 Tax=Methyloversatilis sp. RAC08 TaxID=1842540 RepID=UPI0012376EA2|nr:PEP-CTERM sorting domain-containing protein [Methyloversatilis sp. RAC08]
MALFASAESDTGNVSLSATAYGGKGGYGGAGAIGGAGASVSLTDVVNGQTSGMLALNQGAVGGDGGDSSSFAGVAGSASSRLTAAAATPSGASSIRANAYAMGGNGGNVSIYRGGPASNGADALSELNVFGSGTVWASSTAAGGDGGDASFGERGSVGGQATARVYGQTVGTHSVDVSARVSAGRGGHNRSTGTRGGDGMFAGDARAEGHSVAGSVAVTASAQGGNGGNGGAGAYAGHGGDAILINAVSGSTTGVLALEQRAEGGSGGFSDGGTSGRGAKGYSSLSFNDTDAIQLTGVSIAKGGEAGTSSGGNTSDGGDAHAVVSLTSLRIGAFTSARSEAQGGRVSGSLSRGGDARADSYATGAGWTDSVAEARGGANTAGQAGAAKAEAVSVTTLDNGFASARAAGSSPSNQTDAIARAEARAGGWASASAEGDGRNGEVHAQATASEFLGSRVSTSAQATVSGQTRVMSMVTHAAGLPSYPDFISAGTGLEAVSFATGVTSASLIADSVDPGSSLRKSLEESSSDVVMGYGMMGVSYGSFAQGTQIYRASVDFEFKLDDSSEVTLSLIDFGGQSGGETLNLHFLVSSFGGTILENNFTDLSDAANWFSDHALLLGEYTGAAQFSLQLTMIGDIEQGAGFRYFMSSTATTAPIPEPQIAAMLLAGLGVMGMLMRRRSFGRR